MEVDLIFFAALALYFVYRLLMVVGREDFDDPNITIGDLGGGPGGTASAVVDIPIVREVVVSEETQQEKPDIANVFKKIGKLDQNFTENFFNTAAKAAYDIILTSFAKGDKSQLKELLNSKLYSAFVDQIDIRKTLKQYTINTLIKITTVNVVEAKLQGNKAEIVVEFESEQMCTIYENNTAVSHLSKNLTDRWTFTKNLRSNNPNWLLTATS